ncbi:scarecrow-like protein 1 [Punica granatum]|uniref:Scarecrow-like protein 1 n=1 Tax=Punica granatum TaxID=22663 RepID=A0A6P8BXI4_PUNGR|nr:scarecrow-like protein 1 [Punica granatum]XP_031373953.1 scarecrow-like protein 1 [Punica granatum]XP_031373954.1 scarecrow-like protein 1 [Punica granatum]
MRAMSLIRPKLNHKLMYVSESYSSESYDPKYFIDSSLDETPQPTSSGISEDLLHPPKNQFDGCPSNSESDYLESLSLDCVDYDENKMRLKLQELERVLLNDNEDVEEEDEMFSGPDLSMEVDGEWADQIRPTNLHDSPKESSSTDSYVSSIGSSNKEISQLPSCSLKQLLVDCAAALSEGNVIEASTMIEEVRRTVSIQGDPPQRIAAYMVEGLAARMAASGKYIYKSLKCKEPPSLDRLAAMQILFEICPCFKFGFMAANGAIIEAFKDEKSVHIIDFDINQGNQYITLIQSIASIYQKSNKSKPVLRLTGVDDPESVQRPVGGLKNIGQRLEKLAEALGVPFEFWAVPSKTSLVTPSMLQLKPGEALIVNFAFQLHHMPDESVSTTNERDQLLRMVKGLNPKLVTVVEQDVNTNTAPFFPRFIEAYNYYSAVFDSLDATLPRESPDRMNVERHCLARDIVNIVACEGEERIERYEVAGKWRARMTMAGFTSRPMSRHISDNIREVISKHYCNKYQIKEEMGALHFGWEDKSLIVASAWR